MFEKAFEMIVQAEGGYVNDPADNGGATNFGITINTLKNWRGKNVTHEDVKNMPLQEAKDIYKKLYWDAVRADKFSWPIALLLFDAAVNSGIKNAVVWLQRAVGAKADGVIGEQTIAAARSFKTDIVCSNMAAERMLLLARHEDFQKFGRGWCRRVMLKLIQATKQTGEANGKSA